MVDLRMKKDVALQEINCTEICAEKDSPKTDTEFSATTAIVLAVHSDTARTGKLLSNSAFIRQS